MEKEDSCIINLSREIVAPTIIVGSPNFGMIGTIVTEFLISHLNMVECGNIVVQFLPPVVAVHKGRIIDPIGLFYCQEKNVLIVHIAANVIGLEQLISNSIAELTYRTNARSVVSIDGLFVAEVDDVPTVWYATRDERSRAKLTEMGMDALSDGIISGPSAILLSNSTLPVVALLASSHEQVADSQAAASIVAALDEWFGFDVDPSLLMDYVKKYEEKWKSILSASLSSKEEKNKKYVSYVG